MAHGRIPVRYGFEDQIDEMSLPDWIPVDDALPPEGESVLITWDHPMEGTLVRPDSRKRPPCPNSDDDPVFYPERSETGETLAWMPMPEPYDE
jgi:hypothetical protein